MTTQFSTQINPVQGRLDALKAEFGNIIADRILQSELVDFLWEARSKEHYLGQQECSGSDLFGATEELSRIVVLTCLNRRWYVGLCLVDGEGSATDLLWARAYDNHRDAGMAFGQAR